MCNSNERKPSQEELDSIKFGFKVFQLGNHYNEGSKSNALHSVYSHAHTNADGKEVDEPVPFSLLKAAKEEAEKGWFETFATKELMAEWESQNGFHVFKNLSDAEHFMQSASDFNMIKRLILQKVRIDGLVAIGEYTQKINGIVTPCTTYRCGKIKRVGKILKRADKRLV